MTPSPIKEQTIEAIARVIDPTLFDGTYQRQFTPPLSDSTMELFRESALDKARTIFALLPTAVVGEDVVWLVEQHDGTWWGPKVTEHEYFNGLATDFTDLWIKDANSAWRFARKEDAEAFIKYYGCSRAKATEHIWMKSQAGKEIPDGWQPIETAPRDGRGEQIIAFIPWSNQTDENDRGYVATVYWDPGYEGAPDSPAYNATWTTFAGCNHVKPLYWMPLPSAPLTAIPSSASAGMEDVMPTVLFFYLQDLIKAAIERGITQEEIADACQVSLPTIGRWLEGKRPHVAITRASIEAVHVLHHFKSTPLPADARNSALEEALRKKAISKSHLYLDGYVVNGEAKFGYTHDGYTCDCCGSRWGTLEAPESGVEKHSDDCVLALKSAPGNGDLESTGRVG